MTQPTSRLPSPQHRERLLDLSKHRTAATELAHGDDGDSGGSAPSATSEGSDNLGVLPGNSQQ